MFEASVYKKQEKRIEGEDVGRVGSYFRERRGSG